MEKIGILYYAYLINQWEDIVVNHLELAKRYNLYDRIDKILFCVKYEDENELLKAQNLVNEYSKLEIIHSRHADDPLHIESLDFKSSVDYAESEGVLKLVEECKKNPEYKYLFLHSKGVTNSDSRHRPQMNCIYDSYNVSKQDPVSRTNIAIMDYMNDVIRNWKEYVKVLDNNGSFYKLWNFFWVRGDFVSRFDLEDYKEYAPFGDKINDRHFLAIFPKNLEQSILKPDNKLSIHQMSDIVNHTIGKIDEQ